MIEDENGGVDGDALAKGDNNNENIISTIKGTTTAQSATVAIAGVASSSNHSTPDHRKNSKKKYENEVMRNTLTSRFAEIQPEWTQYRSVT